MKKFKVAKRIVCMILALAACLGIFTATANAASAATYSEGQYVPGFPLAYKASGYNVTVLGKYSNGTKHPSYLYNRSYGPLGKKTWDSNCLLDIDTATGATVYAVTTGTVITNKKGSYDDYYVVVRNTDNTYTYYGHLQNTSACKVGSTITAGSVVGKVSKQSHLHFEWSGHDPYCEYAAKGLVHTYAKYCGAKAYPHTHGAYVALDAAGGSVKKSSVTLSKGATTYGSLPTPTRTGYVFLGWYTQESGGSKVTSSTKPGTAPHTLYAGWTKCKSHSYLGAICTKCGREDTVAQTNYRTMSPTAYKVTKSSSAPVWSRPYSNSSTQVTRMNKGSMVIVVGWTVNREGNTWYKLSTGAWIFSGNVVKTSGNINTQYVKGTSSLNMQSAIGGKVVGSIPEGAAVIVNPAKASGSWVWVTYNGVSGYVKKANLTTKAPKL